MSAFCWWIRMDWHPDAQAALKKDVPFFVRPAVRKRVEAMASEVGLELIELDFYTQAKASMAPKWKVFSYSRPWCLPCVQRGRLNFRFLSADKLPFHVMTPTPCQSILGLLTHISMPRSLSFHSCLTGCSTFADKPYQLIKTNRAYCVGAGGLIWWWIPPCLLISRTVSLDFFLYRPRLDRYCNIVWFCRDYPYG